MFRFRFPNDSRAIGMSSLDPHSQPDGCRSSVRWKRPVVALSLLLMLASADPCNAQFVNRRWAVGNGGYRGVGWGHVQYGAGGYGYNTYGAQTAYGNAVRSQAALTMAQGKARVDQAKANEANEAARQQYIENKARYLQLRNQQKAVIDARNEKELEVRRERAAKRVPPKPTRLYARLSADQLDPTTGKINWPECFLDKEFDEGREKIESAVDFIAQNGPDERSASIINQTAKDMRPALNDMLGDIGFEAYSDARKFVGSLSVEGYYALEGSR